MEEELKKKKKIQALKNKRDEALNSMNDDEKRDYYSQDTPEVNMRKAVNRTNQALRDSSNALGHQAARMADELQERVNVASYGEDNYNDTYKKKKKKK